MPSKVITIVADGAPRKVFTIQERASYDLTIIIKHATHTLQEGTPKIVEERTSVHYSPNSQESCTIKHTMGLDDGSKKRFYQMLKNVKVGSGFRPIFARRCCDMRNDYYIYRKPSLSLGFFEPQAFQLFIGCYVGRKGDKFTHYGLDEANMVQIDFELFTFVILWTFITYPSDATGRSFHTLSMPPADIAALPDLAQRDYLTYAPYGINEQSCIDYLFDRKDRSISSYFDLIGKVVNLGSSLPLLRKIASARLRNGMIDDRKYAEHIRRIMLAQIFDKSEWNFRNQPFLLPQEN